MRGTEGRVQPDCEPQLLFCAGRIACLQKRAAEVLMKERASGVERQGGAKLALGRGVVTARSVKLAEFAVRVGLAGIEAERGLIVVDSLAAAILFDVETRQ